MYCGDPHLWRRQKWTSVSFLQQVIYSEAKHSLTSFGIMINFYYFAILVYVCSDVSAEIAGRP